jgi:hypothetical protein
MRKVTFGGAKSLDNFLAPAARRLCPNASRRARVPNRVRRTTWPSGSPHGGSRAFAAAIRSSAPFSLTGLARRCNGAIRRRFLSACILIGGGVAGQLWLGLSFRARRESSNDAEPSAGPKAPEPDGEMGVRQTDASGEPPSMPPGAIQAEIPGDWKRPADRAKLEQIPDISIANTPQPRLLFRFGKFILKWCLRFVFVIVIIILGFVIANIVTLIRGH